MVESQAYKDVLARQIEQQQAEQAAEHKVRLANYQIYIHETYLYLYTWCVHNNI